MPNENPWDVLQAKNTLLTKIVTELFWGICFRILTRVSGSHAQKQQALNTIEITACRNKNEAIMKRYRSKIAYLFQKELSDREKERENHFEATAFGTKVVHDLREEIDTLKVENEIRKENENRLKEESNRAIRQRKELEEKYNHIVAAEICINDVRQLFTAFTDFHHVFTTLENKISGIKSLNALILTPDDFDKIMKGIQEKLRSIDMGELSPEVIAYFDIPIDFLEKAQNNMKDEWDKKSAFENLYYAAGIIDFLINALSPPAASENWENFYQQYERDMTNWMYEGKLIDFWGLMDISQSHIQPDKDDIKKAYRAAAKKYHPDVVGPDGHILMQQLNTAREVFGNEQKFALYIQALSLFPHS